MPQLSSRGPCETLAPGPMEGYLRLWHSGTRGIIDGRFKRNRSPNQNAFSDNRHNDHQALANCNVVIVCYYTHTKHLGTNALCAGLGVAC